MRRTTTTGSHGGLATKHGTTGVIGRINDGHGTRTCPAPGLGLPPGHVPEAEAQLSDAGHSPCISAYLVSLEHPSKQRSFACACRGCLLIFSCCNCCSGDEDSCLFYSSLIAKERFSRRCYDHCLAHDAFPRSQTSGTASYTLGCRDLSLTAHRLRL